MTTPVTRLAPSPTGALHLGNVRTFVVNWLLARRRGWTIRMRVEDLDGPRIRADATTRVLDDLRWLGLDWDGPVLVQSDDLAPYRDALTVLASRGDVFQCDATRREIERAASAPQEGAHELHYDAALRPTDPAAWTRGPDDRAHRFRVDPGPMPCPDLVRGTVVQDPGREVGDFLVWTKRGTPSYQLAVVVDDLRQGVTDVVRGDDLLPSAARQALLYAALGADPPRWWHLPLVVGPDGRRLAKRHGDTRLATYRAAGVPAERILGWVAATLGLDAPPGDGPGPRPWTLESLVPAIDPASLGGEAIRFTPEDHRWLVRAS